MIRNEVDPRLIRRRASRRRRGAGVEARQIDRRLNFSGSELRFGSRCSEIGHLSGIKGATRAKDPGQQSHLV